MVYHSKRGRILGVPLQFAIVAFTTVVLVIYTSGWAAMTRVEARTGLLQGPDVEVYGNQNTADEINESPSSDIEIQMWERVALFVCPLHQLPLN